jgi:beta-lactamase regulating signal transducer with metallopeptidase domain
MTEQALALLLQQAALISAGILALAVLRPLLKRLGAGALYAAWLLLPLLALTPALPRPDIEPMRVVVQATGATALPALAPPTLPASGMAAAAVALWLGGAVLVLLWQARRQRVLNRFGARLPAGSSPALVGLLRPRMALPADFEQRFTPAQRTLVMAHEAVHRARHDNLWNLLACSFSALHWWNPLAWWAARRMRADQELACDAAVLAAHPQARLDYTRALLAAHDLHHLGAPLSSRWGPHHPLVERIAMLNRHRSLSRRTGLALAAACVGITGLAYAAQAIPGDTGGAATPRKVEIRLTLTSDGSTSTPRLITALGARSRIEWGPSPEKTWRLDLTVNQTADGQLQVVTLPSYAGRPLGDHTGTLPAGESFRQRLGGQDGVPLLEMTRVVNLLPVDVQMPAAKAPAKPVAS